MQRQRSTLIRSNAAFAWVSVRSWVFRRVRSRPGRYPASRAVASAGGGRVGRSTARGEGTCLECIQ